MSIAVGTKIGTYEVRSLLGKGGMGEVYRAHDMRLKRDVAIKVLSAQFGADRAERFQREAEVLAALNHPNIAHIYGLVESGSVPCIVMELVEGQTLQERLARGAIPAAETVRIVRQIAEALEAAHERGIIHRDLKPGNVMLTADGKVKVLDFGLAKSLASESATLSNSPTMMGPSATGVILGTASYMSPEQSRGWEVDKRTDIWAFGCILYEALSGSQAFGGATVTDILAKIIERDPNFESFAAKVPGKLVTICRKCLQKDPKRRFRDIGDVGLELEDALTPDHRQPAEKTGRSNRLIIIGAIALLMVVAAALWLNQKPQTLQRDETLRFTIPPPTGSVFTATMFTPFQQSLSPDGRMLAFIASTQGKSTLWVRNLDSLQPRSVAGTEGAYVPFWSPDSRFVAFFANGKLKKADMNGGSVQTICDSEPIQSGAWNSDDIVLFTQWSGLFQVNASGGTPRRLDQFSNGYYTAASFLPDGRQFVLMQPAGQFGRQNVLVGSLDGGTPKRLLEAGYAEYAPSAEAIVYLKGSQLMAQRFDAATLEIRSEPVLIAEDVLGSKFGSPGFSIAHNGTLAYGTGGSAGQQLVWFNRQGTVLGTVGRPRADVNVDLSPEQDEVALQHSAETGSPEDIVVVNLSNGESRPLTFDPGREVVPIWSGKGNRVLFAVFSPKALDTVSINETVFDLYEKSADGSGSNKRVLTGGEFKLPMDWSRDDRYILYLAGVAGPGASFGKLWVLPLFGDTQPFPFSSETVSHGNAKFSYDSKWIAYTSYERGQGEIHVEKFPRAAGKWQISTNGGDMPRFRRDGKELFYVSLDGKLISVDITLGDSVRLGASRTLFDTRIPGSFIGGHAGYQYDVSKDGQKFLVNTEASGGTTSAIAIVSNWPRLLKR